MKKRLHPLDRPGFGETALQKWLGIFLTLGFTAFLIGGVPSYAGIVGNFLTFLTIIAGLYTGASGGTDFIRAGRYPIYGTPPEIDRQEPILTTDPHPKCRHFDDGSVP